MRKSNIIAREIPPISAAFGGFPVLFSTAQRHPNRSGLEAALASSLFSASPAPFGFQAEEKGGMVNGAGG